MPSRSTQRSRALHRLGLPLTAVAAVCLMAGCAQLPDSGSAPQLKAAAQFEADASLKAPSAQWPQQQWWQAYGDAQLNALVDEALKDSPDLAMAQARLARAEAVSEWVGSTRKPQVSANAMVSQERLSENFLYPPNAMPKGMNDFGRVTLDLHWELDFWGRNRAAVAAATSEVDASQAELAQARLALSAGVAANYAELSRLFANRDTAEKALAIRARTAELFAKRFANGMETRGSVSQADARRAAAEEALLAIDEQIALQRNRLAALLGAGPDRGQKMARPSLKLDRSFGLPAQLSANLLGRRPDIVAARLMAQAQESRITQKKAEFYPNVNLSAFYGVHALGIDMMGDSGSRVAGVGPAISLPIFTGGRLRGELRGAEAAHAGAVANYNATVARALQEVADSAASIQSLTQRLAKVQEAVESATEAHRVARSRYDGGLATYLDVLQAEDGLLQVLNAQTNLRALSVTLDIGLQRALGGGYQADNSQVAQR